MWFDVHTSWWPCHPQNTPPAPCWDCHTPLNPSRGASQDRVQGSQDRVQGSQDPGRYVCRGSQRRQHYRYRSHVPPDTSWHARPSHHNPSNGQQGKPRDSAHPRRYALNASQRLRHYTTNTHDPPDTSPCGHPR